MQSFLAVQAGRTLSCNLAETNLSLLDPLPNLHCRLCPHLSVTSLSVLAEPEQDGSVWQVRCLQTPAAELGCRWCPEVR